MTVQSVLFLLIALVAVVLIVRRQLTWHAAGSPRDLRMPLIVGAIGVLQLLSGKQHPAVTTTDLGLLAIELVLSLGVGALMGRLAVFRADPADRAVLQARTGWAGVSLWIVLIAVRIGLDLTAHALGASFVASTGVVLILLAVTRGTSALVTRARAAQRTAVSA